MKRRLRSVFHPSTRAKGWRELFPRKKTPTVFSRALRSGTVAGLATAATAAIAGERETGSLAAPLNATSHIIWGDKAARQDKASFKYTLTGFLLNHGATIFWASLYERLMHGGSDNSRRRRVSRLSPDELGPVAKPLVEAAGVAAGAYLFDYHVIPKRLTPGFEKRLSGKSMLAVFAAMAIGLAARDVAKAMRRR